MAITNQPGLSTLSQLTRWIEQTDHHAPHRLKLIDRVDAALSEDSLSTFEERISIATQLERWRYQLLNERRANGDDRETNEDLNTKLLAEMDRCFQLLRGTESTTAAFRSPRNPRAAIFGDDVESENASAWIDCSFPLADLEAEAKQLTDRYFTTSEAAGNKAKRRMVLYAPIYVSSECVNHCKYCGFRYPMQIHRTHLNLEQVLDQSRILRKRGFKHQLVVAGDYPSRTSTAYFCELIEALAQQDLQIGIEIAAQSTESYAAMASAGARSVTLYQETYDESVYESVHIRGPKASFDWRLEAPERAAEVGFGRVGFGILLGLADPTQDFLSLIRHGFYLQRRFPNLDLAFSFPRIHEAPDDFEIPYQISDDDLVRFYCATRMLFPQSHLVLSTRESAELRARLAHLCITQMSAGSSTAPGGYADNSNESQPESMETDPDCDRLKPTLQLMGEQFPVTDERSVEEVADWLAEEGFEVCWSF